jgi:hypothetical protein
MKKAALVNGAGRLGAGAGSLDRLLGRGPFDRLKVDAMVSWVRLVVVILGGEDGVRDAFWEGIAAVPSVAARRPGQMFAGFAQ